MTRSETSKIKKNVEDIRSFIESHRRDGVTDERWDHIFHNWKCLGMSTEESDDEDSYQKCRLYWKMLNLIIYANIRVSM